MINALDVWNCYPRYQTRASHWAFGPLTAYVIIPLFLKVTTLFIIIVIIIRMTFNWMQNIYADMEAAEKLMEEEWGKVKDPTPSYWLCGNIDIDALLKINKDLEI